MDGVEEENLVEISRQKKKELNVMRWEISSYWKLKLSNVVSRNGAIVMVFVSKILLS